jgi:hypothetical protein
LPCWARRSGFGQIGKGECNGMTGAIENVRLLRQLSRSPFLQRAEASPSLQAIVLLMGWWVAVSLAWVGTPLWIWLGGALLLTAGHAFSWIFRAYKSPIRAGIVSIALVGTLALIPDAVSRAVSGDWLPLAYFLVLFQGVASFEMRTRGGLYASIIISGAIFFFVSQQALDITFIIFLTGYTTLLLSFLALSFLLDQVRNADVRWFQSRFSFTLFWTGVFIASMLVSAAIFLLLPKHFIDPINNAQGAILPMRASDSISLPEVTFDQAAGGALPVTAASQDEQPGIAPIDAEAAASVSNGQAGESQSETDAQLGNLGPETGVAVNQPGGTAAQPIQESAVPAESLEASFSGSNDIGFLDQFENDALIMQVRSPVLTYWRERAYDVFDGHVWDSDRTAWFRQSSGTARDVYTAPQPRSVRRGHLYNQTFLVMQPQSSRRFLSGYAPLVASIPVADDGSRELEEGSVYRIISSLPDYSLENLRNADPSSRLKFRYHQVPQPDKEEIEFLAKQITAGVFTDVDRVRRIITYIDRNYSYDTSARNQLELTTAPVEFLRGCVKRAKFAKFEV